MSIRSLARRLAGHLTVGIVTAVAGGVIGAAITASGTVPLSQPSVTVPAPVTSNTLGVVRYDVTSDPCPGALVYVTRTAMAAGDGVTTGGCVDPSTLSDSILSH